MNSKVEISSFFREHKVSGLQLRVFIFVFLVIFLDGYDTAVIGYIAPSLISEWGIKKPDLAPVLSAALFGLAFGTIFLGSLADKFGRKIVLILSVILFGVGSLFASQVSSLDELVIWRVITGIGLGAAMPNATTLASEYAPSHRRSFIVNTAFCGFALGLGASGFIAAAVIPAYGWRMALILGGVAPLVIAIFMIFMLPESIRFLLLKKSSQKRVHEIINKIDASISPDVEFVLEEKQVSKNVISEILSKRYFLGVVLLSIVYLMGLVIIYAILNWMPTLFTDTANTAQGVAASKISMPQSTASIITGISGIGGLGAIFTGWLMDKFNGFKTVAIINIFTAILVFAIGLSLQESLWVLVAVILLAGIAMNTSQTSLPSLASGFYPTHVRTTGVSLMLGIGRFGGILGTFLVARLIKQEFAINEIFYVLAIPALIQVVCLLALYKISANRA